MSDSPPSTRLRWQCRRGMLEIDVLLNGFLERGYTELDTDQKGHFERLLCYPDQILIEWLMERKQPRDGDLAQLIPHIRRAARP
jgi:antitoxin CptB